MQTGGQTEITWFYRMKTMNIILQLDKAQEDQIPLYIEKWRSKCLLTNPVNPVLFEQGMQDIHEELGMEAPREFLYFPSPTAMWREFEVWKPKVTRVLTQYWRYQIPLCDPSSMHRRFPGSGRAAFNFAARRYSPGPHSALRETEDSNEESGTIILSTVHARLWKRFDFDMPFNLSLVSTYACFDFEAPGEYLYERAGREDPANQIDYTAFCFLGPDYWLLRELACVDYCHRVLGIDRNKELYSGLEAIVGSGSFCGVFGTLCVACERPGRIEVEDKIFRLIFRDGEMFSNEGWKQNHKGYR
jgi:hypothetical protein